MIKTTIALAAVAAVAVNGYVTYPEFCGPAELNKLAPVAATNVFDLLACQTASGRTFVPPTAEPTTKELTVMCNTKGCQNLLAAVKKLGPSDCFFSLGNTTDGINVKKLVDEFEPFCELAGL